MDIRKIYTPNVNERKGGVSPDALILHYTATATGEEAEREFLTNPDAAVSAHYMVDLDGAITQYVEEDKKSLACRSIILGRRNRPEQPFYWYRNCQSGP